MNERQLQFLNEIFPIELIEKIPREIDGMYFTSLIPAACAGEANPEMTENNLNKLVQLVGPETAQEFILFRINANTQ